HVPRRLQPPGRVRPDRHRALRRHRRRGGARGGRRVRLLGPPAPPIRGVRSRSTADRCGLESSRVPPHVPEMALDTESATLSEPNMLGSALPVLAVVNQKGGVGKTTTAINLGAALTELGHPVLLIDLDPQANSTSGLGLNPARARLTTYHVLMGEATLAEAEQPTSVKGMQLVPSSIDLAGAEIELASLPERETRLRSALLMPPSGVELVIVDCPPSLGLLTLNALAAATQMLIPTQCEFFALEGLRHLYYTHQLVRSGLNPRLEVGGILMTQFDARTTLAWDVLAEVRRSHADDVLTTLIPRNVRISQAPSHGKSVLDYDPTCRGAVAYRELARELISRSAGTR